jgi:TIR domain
MAQIFISYNHRSLDAVKTLAKDLEAAGNYVWFDQALTGGHRWWDDILANIRGCGVFVFALTPESVESYACKQELDYAAQLGKPILPILLSDKVEVNLLPHPLSEIQFVDYRRQDRQTGFALIKKAVNSLPSAIALPDPLPEPPPSPASYLGKLKERIDTTENLNFQEQIALVFDLKEHVRDGCDPEEVGELFLLLKQRDDLLARVENEIDEALVPFNSKRMGWRRFLPRISFAL